MMSEFTVGNFVRVFKNYKDANSGKLFQEPEYVAQIIDNEFNELGLHKMTDTWTRKFTGKYKSVDRRNCEVICRPRIYDEE